MERQAFLNRCRKLLAVVLLYFLTSFSILCRVLYFDAQIITYCERMFDGVLVIFTAGGQLGHTHTHSAQYCEGYLCLVSPPANCQLLWELEVHQFLYRGSLGACSSPPIVSHAYQFHKNWEVGMVPSKCPPLGFQRDSISFLKNQKQWVSMEVLHHPGHGHPMGAFPKGNNQMTAKNIMLRV